MTGRPIGRRRGWAWGRSRGREVGGPEVEAAEAVDGGDAVVDLVRGEPRDALGAELLHVERGQGRAVGRRTPQHVLVERGRGVLQVLCHVADEAARERV